MNSLMVNEIETYALPLGDEELNQQLPINIEVLNTSSSAFQKWHSEHNHLNYTRAIRYYIALQLLELTPSDNLLDIGGGNGLFYNIVTKKNVNAFVVDLGKIDYSSLPHDKVLKKNIIDTSVAHLEFNKIYLGHTYEHFKKNQDIDFIHWLSKEMPNGGRCIIEPLFIGSNYLEIYNFKNSNKFDRNATYVQALSSMFPGSLKNSMGFSRVYNPKSLSNRILKTCYEHNLTVRIFTATQDNIALPDMSKYKFKEKEINYPLRLICIEKRA